MRNKNKAVVRGFSWKKAMGSCLKSGTSTRDGNSKEVVVKAGNSKGVVVKPVKAKSNLKRGKHKQTQLEPVTEGSGFRESKYEDENSQPSSSESIETLIKGYNSKKRKLVGALKGKSRKNIPKTEGQNVLARGEVLKHHYDNVRKPPNIVCRVKSFCDDIENFDEDRKNLVRRMGFGSLLSLNMKNIPRLLCYWLMTRVQGDGTIVFGDGGVLPVGPNQVSSILGIPMGAKKVPNGVDMEDVEQTQKVESIVQRYGVGEKKEKISLY